MAVAWLLPFDDSTLRANLEALQADILQRTQRAVEEAIRDNVLGVADFAWTDDASLNARVFRKAAEQASIRVNLGTMIRVYAVFMALLSDPRFLPDISYAECRDDLTRFANELARSHLIGDEAFTLVEGDGLGGVLTSTRFDGAVQPHGADTLLLFLAPVDERRSRTALALANLALDFVLWHEIAHAARGHLELLPAGRLQILEVAPSEGEDDASLLRVLEHDADTCAALSWARSVLEDGEGFAWFNMADVLDDRERRMSYLMLSLGVLFVMFSAASENASSHPSPELRFWNMHDKVRAYVAQTVPEGAERWERASVLALTQMDQLAERLGRGGATFAASRERLKSEIDALDRALDAMSHQLRRFANLERLQNAASAGSRR
jgi:hypothetical protein